MKQKLPEVNSSTISITLILLFVGMFAVKTQAALTSYGFSTSTGVALESMSGGTTQLVAPSVDNGSSLVTNIGFSFALNGTNYTQFSVNSNGLMRLGATAVSTSATNALAGSADLPKISPYWDDLTIPATGSVRYKLVGSSPSRKLVVEWNLVTIKPSSANVTFQIWLFETSNNIQFVYGTGLVANSANGGYSVGISTATTDYISVNASTLASSTSTVTDNNSVAISSGRSFLFASPPGCATSLSPAASATGVSPNTATLSWSAGSGAPTGYNVYFGTTSTPPLVSTNQAATTYSPGTLSWNSVYYWKVVPVNNGALATGCATNSFTTGSLLSYEITRTTGITFTSIATTGTSVASWRAGTNTDDNLSNSVPIGFNFSYSGSAYSSFLVSTNGFITLNTSTVADGTNSNPYGYLNSALSDGNASPVSTLVIAPFYEDIYCQGNPGLQSGLDNSIKYQVTGTSPNRVLTVEWIGMEGFNSAGPDLNFQVKLYEGSNNIDFVYGKMEGFDGNSNLNYSFSCGLNAVSLSPSILTGELINQLTADTRNFGMTPSSQLNQVPECYSKIQFVPGTYTAYTPPVSLAPPNDEKATAITLPVNTVPCTGTCGHIYTSAHATASSGFTACPAGNADDDVWFQFVATTTNTIIKVQGSGNYDPTIQLYNSSNTLIACGNSSFTLGSSETLTAQGATALTVGQTYYIRVYDRNAFWGSNSSGQFAICVSEVPTPPANDDCAGSIMLTVTQNPVYINGTSTVAATASSGVPVCTVSGTTPDDDVWYKFSALNTTEVITVAGNTGFNAVIQLFSGTCGALTSLNCVNFWGNGQTETITANNLVRNSTYYFRVYHATAGGGSGSYSVAVTSPPPACTFTLLPPNNETNVPANNSPLIWDPVPGADNYKVLLDTVNPPVQQLTITTDTFAIMNGLKYSKTYYWSVKSGNATGFNSSCIVFNFTTEQKPLTLVIRAFLQGLYQPATNDMKTYLNPADTLADSISVDLVDIDTVTEASVNTVISKNGYITIGIPIYTLNNEYYIVLKHRNHVETWSDLYLYDGFDTLYDFTDSVDKAFGSNMIQVNPGKYAIYVGDVNQDGLVNAADVTDLGEDAGLFPTGLPPGDINFDHAVESTDFSIIENKLPLLLHRITPFDP